MHLPLGCLLTPLRLAQVAIVTLVHMPQRLNCISFTRVGVWQLLFCMSRRRGDWDLIASSMIFRVSPSPVPSALLSWEFPEASCSSWSFWILLFWVMQQTVRPGPPHAQQPFRAFLCSAQSIQLLSSFGRLLDFLIAVFSAILFVLVAHASPQL